MELNNTSSDSDERMKKRFSFEYSAEKKEEDDEEDENEVADKKQKSSDKKTPSRSLFFGSNKRADESSSEQDDPGSSEKQAEEARQRSVLLKTILGDEKTKPSEEAGDQEPENDDLAVATSEAASDDHTEDTEQASNEEGETTIEPSDESLESENERLEAELQDIVEDKIEKLQQVAAPEAEEAVDTKEPDTRAAELAADLSFLEKVSAKMKDGVEAPVAIEESVAESLAEAEEDVSEAESSEDTLADEAMFGTEDAPENDERDDPLVAAVSASTAAAASSRSSTPPSPVPTTTARITPPPTPAAVPPIVPPTVSPIAPPSPRLPRNPSPINTPNAQPFPSFSPNILAAPSAAIGDTVRANDVYRRNRNTGKIILAGVVGYAFGRRRGRINTEKRMQPEIDVGNKLVKDFEQKLAMSEQSVRQKSAEVTRTKDELSERNLQKSEAEKAQQQAERTLYEQQNRVPTAAEMLAGAQTENPVEAGAAQTMETAPQLQDQMRVEQNNRSPSELLAMAIPTPAQEGTNFGKELLRAPFLAAIGSEAPTIERPRNNMQDREEAVLQANGDPALRATEVLNSASSLEATKPRALQVEQRKQTDEQIRKKAIERVRVEVPKPVDVQTMTMPELLSVAEKIDVGSGNLKEMFEHHRIDAVNLRRVIAEYSEGKNYQETLHRSLEAEEMHRELRNEVKTDDSAGGAGGSGASGAGGGAATTTSPTSSAQKSIPDDRSRPLDIPPPSAAFISGQPRSDSAQSNQENITMSPVSSAVVVVGGVVLGAVVAAILLIAFGIV